MLDVFLILGGNEDEEELVEEEEEIRLGEKVPRVVYDG